MSLLLPREAFAARRAAAAGPLAALADGLAAELAPVVERAASGTLVVPAEKALLSRVGGRCENDGELLEFDPESPRAHRCPRCGAVWRGEWHDRFWPYWYQLWLAERAVHGALLYRLRGDAAHLALARHVLDAYADRYLEYPDRDNVLGPSRPFFSTYLESIWLLQLCIALDLLEEDDDPVERSTSAHLGARFRERVIAPSERLIAGYDEGMSNRQVWNAAALMAARALLGRPDAVAASLEGPSGVLAHLERSLLSDGTWYEGENYHLFAHRGLWYSVTMAEAAGVVLAREAMRRFREGFAAPFLSAFPDLTLPARRDSQYAIALRQPRFAELCELGLARAPDARLAGALAALYAPGADLPAGDTGRARSTADVERNRGATRLSRADLGWRSLLHALPELPPLEPSRPRSVLLEGQGLAVFRREGGRRYAALDYGHSGGGHGHPDRLNLLVAEDEARWLDDMGTGSYVERTLHWYRSTLAHDAPLVDGHSQRRVSGRLLAHDEWGAAGWALAEAEVAPGVRVRRALVVMPDYLVDRLEWEADRDVAFDLPLHLDGESLRDDRWRPATLDGGGEVEDGFDFVHDAERAPLAAREAVELRARAAGRRLTAWRACTLAGEWWRARAPGPPGRGERRFHLLRARGARGRVVTLLAFGDAVEACELEGDAVAVRCADGTRHVHAPADWGWHIDLAVGAARSSIDLGGLRPAEPAAPVEASQRPEPARPAPVELPALTPAAEWLSDLAGDAAPGTLRARLGAAHYLRSEASWEEAGGPAALVTMAWDGSALRVEADVRTTSAPRFVPAGTENPYDNEPAEVNGDGVQLYVAVGARAGGWLLVPEPGGGVRARPVSGWSGLELADTRWRSTPHGYTLRARVPLRARDVPLDVALDVVVNETAPERARRRGQLVLSGGGGFVYLRGDRHEIERLLPLRLLPARAPGHSPPA